MANQKKQVIGIFPIPILVVRGALAPADVAAVAEKARTEVRATNSQSDRLSHTKAVNPDSDPLFKRIAAGVRADVSEFGALLLGERLGWNIKEIWLNVLEKGGHQSLHNHVNSFVSGILYITEQHASTGTVFHKALGGSEFSFVNQNDRSVMGPFNARRWQIPKVGPGDMVLFPSYLLHEVPQNVGAQRISVAFNAIPDSVDSFGYAVRLS